MVTALKWGLRNWYDEMVLFAGTGFLAGLASLPFIAVMGLAFVILQLPLIFFLLFALWLPSPALVGMYGLIQELAKGEGVGWGLFWQTIRQYWRRSLILWFISLAATLILLTSMLFYMGSDNQILQFIGYAWLYGIVLWLAMQMYLLPLLLEQEQFNVVRLYRNAVVVAVAKPVLTLVLIVVSVLLLIAGAFTVIGLPLVALPLMASFAGHGLRFAIYGPPEVPK
ncbi:MAG: YesL family protein [Chloroflexota bacterium]